MTLAKESKILIVICALDLALTLFLLQGQFASEGNPIMAHYLKYGVITFIMMKVMLVSAPILVFEWCRQFRPRFVQFMLRTTIAAYVGIYATLFLMFNVGL